MIAQRLSAAIVPILQGFLVIMAGWFKALGLALVKLVTWVITDFAAVAGAGAIVWGIHFFGLPNTPIGTPLSWICGGALTILFVAVGVKPLR